MDRKFENIRLIISENLMPLKDKYFISVLLTQFRVIYILLSMSSSISYNNALLLLNKSLK